MSNVDESPVHYSPREVAQIRTIILPGALITATSGKPEFDVL